ncbi:MAG: DAK2 domain-containing protein [Clostridia bacterium]|nr:DAK2 domain-containing protein [Clostridia bacterium]
MAAARLAPDKSVSAVVLRKMLVAGSKMLEVNKESVNALNVFPVPDGDTGTNMSLTMISAMKEVCKNTTNTMEALCQDLTKGALRGARGNSGVILSQILKGFANVVSPQQELDIKNFARALKSGVELAYSAVAKPKEGTMLTVIRVMTEHALGISKKPLTYDNFLSALIEKGEEILAQTPEMLDVLKKAGVVDSGGYGIVMIFKGMLKGYRNEEIEGAEDYVPTPVSLNLASGAGKMVEDIQIDYENLDDIEFAYCTEFFIINLKKKTTVSDIDKLREKLNNIGDSTLVIGDLSLVKVHVHTNNPGTALSYALQLGEVDKIKIENMLEQNRELKAKYEAERKNIGILTICSGEGMASIFKDLGVDRVVEGGQTMNPSAEDIALAVNKINAENVIILPNNKNIILAAEQSRSLVKKKTVYVVQSTNIPQGLSATLAFNTEINIAENIENMNEALSTVKSGSVTFAVRTSKIDDVEVKEGDVIGLFESKIAAVGTTPEAVTNELIDKMIDEDDEIMTLYYGEGVTPEQAEAFGEELAERYPDFEVSVHCGGQSLYYYLISIE